MELTQWKWIHTAERWSLFFMCAFSSMNLISDGSILTSPIHLIRIDTTCKLRIFHFPRDRVLLTREFIWNVQLIFWILRNLINELSPLKWCFETIWATKQLFDEIIEQIALNTTQCAYKLTWYAIARYFFRCDWCDFWNWLTTAKIRRINFTISIATVNFFDMLSQSIGWY